MTSNVAYISQSSLVSFPNISAIYQKFTTQSYTNILSSHQRRLAEADLAISVNIHQNCAISHETTLRSILAG